MAALIPFVYDFKDINSRMKGDLLPRKEPVVELMPPPLPSWRNMNPKLCINCHGCGQDQNGLVCLRCFGSGVEP